MILKSVIVFVFIWWVIRLKYRAVLILFLSTIIGVACIFLGDMGYWSDNDILKLIAPVSLFLLMYDKEQGNGDLLYIFLIPYLLTSFEFFSDPFLLLISLASHAIIIFSIIIVKQNIYFSIVISTIVGVLINLIGDNFPPGTNETLMNPALITMAAKGIKRYTGNNEYTCFLKYFWLTFVGFAFFGNWVLYFVENSGDTMLN